MKNLLIILTLAAFAISASAATTEKIKPVKNIILLISDGTSVTTMSSARWLQVYNDPANQKLALDPWLCGTVRTTNSDAPIGDSAPTTSCYVTGHASRAGYISTFPPYMGEANLVEIDSTRKYAPMATILEAGKQLQNKAAGLVFTCQFPHATPADCASHYYNRGASQLLADQMVHNNLDVVIGGGNAYLSKDGEAYLKGQGYTILRDNLQGLRADKSTKLWSLFCPVEMPYELDRDANKYPSLAEMAKIAIQKLSKNKNGFFLMIEGSKVDWAAHNNDPAALPSEFLSFDAACREALEFAKKDGNTAVIITCDHSNSGFSIGRSGMGEYSKMPLSKLFGQVAKYKRTSEGLEELMNSQPFDSLTSIFKTYAGIDLSNDEIQLFMNTKDYKSSPIPENLRQPNKESALYSSYLSGVITKVLTAHTYFAWTTGGHTGEDVFLACYNPNNQRPLGMQTNEELARYMQSLWGLDGKMDQFTDKIFARHKEVFKGYQCEINKPQEKNVWPTLTVTNPANNKQLFIKANNNIIEVRTNGKTQTVQLPSVITYVDRNDMFYLPSDLAKYIK